MIQTVSAEAMLCYSVQTPVSWSEYDRVRCMFAAISKYIVIAACA